MYNKLLISKQLHCFIYVQMLHRGKLHTYCIIIHCTHGGDEHIMYLFVVIRYRSYCNRGISYNVLQQDDHNATRKQATIRVKSMKIFLRLLILCHPH